MIDYQHFKSAMEAISERCAKPLGPRQLTMYYRFLSPRLTTDEFHDAAMSVWSSVEFFPPPVKFLEARSGREWDRVVKLVESYTPPVMPNGWAEAWEALPNESKIAISRLGGMLAFKEQAYNRDAVRAYDQFTKAYQIALQDVSKESAGVALVDGVDRPLLRNPEK